MRLSQKAVLVAVFATTLGLLDISAAAAKNSATGSFGQSISVAKSTFSSSPLNPLSPLSKQSQTLLVSGKGFDETIGIYLAYCVLPEPAKPPTPCGGGANKSGIGGASIWLSSNAPAYGKNLAIPFKAGGRFTEKIAITRMIGKFDCTKVKCAITVRSDHLHEGDRTSDLFIPITFKTN